MAPLLTLPDLLREFGVTQAVATSAGTDHDGNKALLTAGGRTVEEPLTIPSGHPEHP